MNIDILLAVTSHLCAVEQDDPDLAAHEPRHVVPARLPQLEHVLDHEPRGGAVSFVFSFLFLFVLKLNLLLSVVSCKIGGNSFVQIVKSVHNLFLPVFRLPSTIFVQRL